MFHARTVKWKFRLNCLTVLYDYLGTGKNILNVLKMRN